MLHEELSISATITCSVKLKKNNFSSYHSSDLKSKELWITSSASGACCSQFQKDVCCTIAQWLQHGDVTFKSSFGSVFASRNDKPCIKIPLRFKISLASALNLPLRMWSYLNFTPSYLWRNLTRATSFFEDK